LHVPRIVDGHPLVGLRNVHNVSQHGGASSAARRLTDW
jgi:hypothetical protein